MMTLDKKFRISSALKNIIGKDLITDDFIAVFELVKNSYDAHANRVDVIFKDIYGEDPQIIIKDNGKGMDDDDLDKKWLFVAYSAKHEGTEDDYRDKIKSPIRYAGSKGIGRFSCDKLGDKLQIYTKKADVKTIYKLSVDWVRFEDDVHKDFIGIPVDYSTTRSNTYNLNKGTVLEIRGLRENWSRGKLLKLKRSLEKLINPNQSDKKRQFKIFLSVPEERKTDKEIKNRAREEGHDEEPWDIVNGEIKNFLFENLGLRTTQIRTYISKDGSKITTTLEDRGALIYEIIEENLFRARNSKLKDIDIHLFALNRAAKVYFSRRMGVRAVDYGSVFLYKNGFRVYPFGEVGDDGLRLDRRKIQHGGSHLGSRDVIGRIEVNGDNPEFQETTSRDGGLVNNESYENLVLYFTEYAVRRLERFVNDIKKYGLFEGDISGVEKNKNIKTEIFNIITGLSKPKRGSLIDIKYDADFVNILKESGERSLKTFLKAFEKVADDSVDESLKKDVYRAQKRLAQLAREKKEVEEYAEKQSSARISAENKAQDALNAYERERKKNLFYKATSADTATINIALIHHIKLTSESLDARVSGLYRDIINDKFNKKRALKYLAEIKLLSDKALKLSEIASLADINFKYEKQKVDLVRYLQEYIYEIKGLQKELIISVITNNVSHAMRFSVLEFTIVIDNLVSNAIKAGANTILFEAKKESGRMELIVSDDGVGVDADIANEIFEPGVTNRRGGSGIGLYIVRDILNEIKASIEFAGNGMGLSGAAFVIRF